MPTRPDAGRRRLLTSVAATCLAAPCVRPAAGQGRLEKPRVVLAAVGHAGLYGLPLTLARHLGYWQAQGLDVDLLEAAGEAHALQMLAAGQADLLSLPFEQTLRQQARGRPLQAVVVHGRAPQVALGVSTRNLPTFSGLAELRGHSVGVSAPDSSSALVARLTLARAGLRVEDVNLVSYGTHAAALAAVRAGQLDAACSMDPLMTLMEQKSEVRIVSDTRTLRGTQEVFGGPMAAGCLCAPVATLQRHPRTLQALTDGVLQALRWLQTAGPRDLIRAVPDRLFGGDRALYLAAFGKMREAISLDGQLHPDAAWTALRVLSAADPEVRLGRVDLALTWAPEFTQRSAERVRA